MPRPKSIEPLKTVTINVFESDYNRLADIFPTAGKQVAIRLIVRQFIQQWDKDNERTA